MNDEPLYTELDPTAQGQAKAFNPNTWANAGMSAEEVNAINASPVDSNHIHNQRMPQVVIQSERPEHTIVCFLKAQGLSNVEIAQRTNYTVVHIATIVKQPWARKKIGDLIREAGGNEINTLLQSAATDSIYKLIELRDSAPVPAVQRAAADSLLDRYLGKPVQHIETKNVNTNISIDPEELKKELDDLNAEENRLLGRN